MVAGTQQRLSDRDSPWLREPLCGNRGGRTEISEAVMTGAVVVVAVVVFVAGLLVGVVAAGAVVLRREDRAHALGGRASGRLGVYARRLHGLDR
jgi:hypothetical protein